MWMEDGKYSDTANASACTACPAGKYDAIIRKYDATIRYPNNAASCWDCATLARTRGPGTSLIAIAPSIKVVAAAVADGVQTVTVTPGGGRCLVVCAEAVLPQRLPRRGLVVYDALGFLVFLVEHFPMHLEIVWFVD